MSKIVWNVQEMYDLGLAARRIDQQLRGVDTALRSDIDRLHAVQSTLRKYGIPCPSLDTITTYQEPSKSVAAISVEIVRLGRQVDNLVTILNEIERQAEARNGTLMGGNLPPQMARKVEATRRALLQNPQLPLLLKLRSEMGSTSFRDTDDKARTARRWLESNVADHATRLWILENSPDVARLLAENVDEGDAAVRELRALTERPGSHPFEHFLRLSPERREWLAIAYPSLVGNLDGAPPKMRWTANRINLVAYREKLFSELEVSQAQGYRAPARDESSLSLRMESIDLLLASPGGYRVLAFDKPDAITPMQVALDGSAAGGVSPVDLARLMNTLSEAAGQQQGYSEALLSDLDTLSRSDDPAVARFGREMGADLRSSGRIDPGRAAELLGKVEFPLAIAGILADANQRIQEGDKPPDAVLGAVGKGVSSAGGAAGAGAICLATGVAAAPCALIAVGGGVAGELLWNAGEASRDYAFSAAPGDVDSSKLAMYADVRPYAPEKHFIPLPTKPQDLGPGVRAGIPRPTTAPLDGPWLGHPGQRGGVPTHPRPADWP